MKKTLPDKKNKPATKKPSPAARTEKDADDLAHSQQAELPKEAGQEEDLDDLVHRPQKPQPGSLNESKMEDPDDLVHRQQEEEEEEEEDKK